MNSKEQLFYPDSKLSSQANINTLKKYHQLCKMANDDYEGFWDILAKEEISWSKPYSKVLDNSLAPHYKWFQDGELNVAYQCIGRHLKNKSDKIAIIFEGDDGENINISYTELAKNVNKFANMLKDKFNIQKGDRVVLYMPMILESAYAMLACTQIGAIHSIVFGGFSAEALASRIDDTQAKLVITSDGAFRKGKSYMLKPVVDKALTLTSGCVDNTLVIKRNFEDITINENDVIYNDIIEDYSDTCEYENLGAEDTMFLLYTSGSTGKPKGVQHSYAGYILWATLTSKWVFDMKPDDIFWCSADIGWITGHTYSIYGPLSVGATLVMFEGVLTYPDSTRAWDMIQRHKVSIFYTAPTAIRLLHSASEDAPTKFDLSSLRILGTVGEPIDENAWKWYYEVVGQSKCPIVDTWWQTETGGHMIAPLPYATPIKPSCATLPLPGIYANILDENGDEVKQGEKGLLCITKPWPSMIRTIWGDDERFKETYFGSVKKENEYIYFSGDGAYKDENGYITITGRVDDVLNISGHIIGTAEVESAITDVQEVYECAVVSIPDDIKGESIFAYVVSSLEDNKKLQILINKSLSLHIGNIAKVDNLAIIPALPKTRSGKIMRRLLKSIAKKEQIQGDISTLENPEIVSIIQKVINV